MDAIDILTARGFIKQSSHPEELREALASGPLTFYVGFDPTATSLHAGSLLQIMAISWLQRLGHKAIVLVGGGTARLGDPSGKTELRTMLSDEEIAKNSAGLRGQLSRYLVLDGEKGELVDNSDWLMGLTYLPFLREIGAMFSINKMLSAEGYKQRLERGLSFIELNYQIMQAYDFLELHRTRGCSLQLGGDDQWSNILAGVDLVRRKESTKVFGLTTPLLTTASGAKMGKTVNGAIWLDGERCKPFDYWQFWYNCDDRDVAKFLKLYTYLELDEIERLASLQGAELRKAKRILANACTTLLHGKEASDRAEAAAAAMVGGQASDDLPTCEATAGRLVNALADAGLAKSRGEGRRLIKGGAVKLDGEKVTDPELDIDPAAWGADGVVVRVGKKRAARLIAAG